jgi:hypothetical protein
MLMTKTSEHLGRAALIVALLSAPAWAQEGLRSASLPEASVGTPRSVDLHRAGPRTYAPPAPRVPRDRRHHRFPSDAGFFPFVAPWAPYGLDAGTVEQEPGFLLPRIVPGTTEVIVDGLYVGSVDDLRRSGRGHALEPGPHRLELRAPGYEPVTVGVTIAPDETLFYQRELEAAPRPAPVLPPPGMPKTFYVIPGCYAGDRPPQADRLPPNCDAANARTIPPQVSAVRVGN